MVERLEAFAVKMTGREPMWKLMIWKRAGRLECSFVKFWVQIDKDTQLARFKERENTPEKRWKITDEDWRNREKWDLYEEAVNEMLQKTNTA